MAFRETGNVCLACEVAGVGEQPPLGFTANGNRHRMVPVLAVVISRP